MCLRTQIHSWYEADQHTDELLGPRDVGSREGGPRERDWTC